MLYMFLMMEFIALTEFGWFIVANVIPGLTLPMLTTLVLIMPFWEGPATVSLAPINSIIIVPPPILALELQLLF